ncbi:transposase [Streptomyces europaeiscabiei]|nr:transposase [Streptomyces europaeiscabiei]
MSAWRAERRRHALDIGRPPEHDLREIMNAILYVDPTGVQGRCLPHDFPPFQTCYGYLAKWQKDGALAQLTGVLRSLLRQKEGKRAEPSACVIDAQSVKTSTSVPGRRAGHLRGEEDRGPQAEHRHRHPRTAARGAGHGREPCRTPPPAPTLVDQVAAAHPSVRQVWVDGGYRQHLVEHAARLGKRRPWNGSPSPPSSPMPGAGSIRRSRNCGRTPGRSSPRSCGSTPRSAASSARRMRSSR